MDRHTCKVCFRRFHNGRALGGHMRSHVMAASAAAYSPLLSRQPQSPPLSLASTSSTEMDDDKPAAQQEPPPTPCVVREGTKKRFDDSPGFSSGGRAAACGESSVVQEGESDTESSSPRFAVSRRRSKRARRRSPPPPPAAAVASSDPEQPAASGVSDATPVEDVAMSLVMLSRDSWTRSSRSGRGAPASSEAAEQNDDGVRSFVGAGAADDADHHEDDDVARRPRGGRHHQCGVCRKVFRSYQALGGHRASIKKGKGGCVPVPVPPPAAPSSSKAHRAENGGPAAVHECPFCFRVFESGQALGGHKRAHMPYAATGAPAAPLTTPSPRAPAAKCGDSSGSFDLNVPAAATDDDFELSSVYDTELLREFLVCCSVMDRHTCKVCFRRFHNGRALGGHMRSHVMAASAAAYSPLLSRQPQSPPLSLASTSSTEMDDDKPAAQQEPPPTPCVVREGTKKRFDDSPGFSSGGRAAACGESSVVQEGESDTESSSPRFAVSRRRSKRARRRSPPPPPAAAVASSDPEQPAASGVSDATPVEDVAMSLVMLSRDSWTRSSRSGRGAPASSEAAEQNDDGVRSFVGAGAADDADHHEDDDVARRPRGGRHHQCGVCRKVFRSYQALGGHRASIKKGKGGCVPVPVPPPAAPSSSKAHRAENGGPAAVHECPFCFRVFESGQALGGHKRAHMPYAATGAPAAPLTTPSPRAPAAKCGDSSGSFDLNVPAAATDDDFELSSVYDTEFGGARQ